MKLISDANEIFSIIIAKGKNLQTKKLDILFSDKVELYAPTLLFLEFERNSQEIKEKSGFSDSSFNVFIGILKLRIKIVSFDELFSKLEEAKSICPHEKDLLYFALALKLNCPIWSGEKRFKEQSRIEVFNTKDLVKKFGL